MNIHKKILKVSYIAISVAILSSLLISDERSQMRQVDINEKNLLTLFAKENAKAKAKGGEESPKVAPDINSSI